MNRLNVMVKLYEKYLHKTALKNAIPMVGTAILAISTGLGKLS
jgi:hypothetical protein